MTADASPKRALFQEPSTGPASREGAVRCLLCPRRCVIPVGSAGFCGARANRGTEGAGVLVAEGYGVVSALALDPIEKKPLARYKPGSMILSAGGYGCNLSCRFCQNHRIARARPPSAADRAAVRSGNGERTAAPMTPETLVGAALSCRERGNVGLAFTYNEPLINVEYVADAARLAKSAGLDVVLVTNGYVNPEPLEYLLPFVDAMNVDLKAFTDGFYETVCGGTRLPVMETIRRAAGRCHVEVTTLVIPGLNSSPAEILALSEWLASVSPAIPLHLTRHHPDYLMPEPPPVAERDLLGLVDLASTRLETVIAGNLRNFP